MSGPRWTCQRFDDLGLRGLYRALRLRSEVFVIEQRCIYLDPDGLDEDAWHLQGLGQGVDGAEMLFAYARLLPPSIGDGSARIGRVITAPTARGGGLGRALVSQAVRECQKLWPATPIELGAQAHLRAFYGSFGFVPVSDVYDEDGIPHIDMRKEATP
ncbi:GNAT family N-acetyltransferase [Mitsuaria sp. GD03876]|uniref:GNAT family N-acetyltransferase n=1 Tax=Mitsuaria sp. GD03876 TaxID=2975399 RepID=UPI002449F90B|nr:GNAT family N-acetyltransferase [Mitsuaria sp. GD03876]MDH0865220.1 GNAT family N-acetyltransferase [Mitsuaria sp. GD03876]